MTAISRPRTATAIALGLSLLAQGANAQSATQTTATPYFLGRILALLEGTSQVPAPVGQVSTTLDSEALAAAGGTGSIDQILRQQASVTTRINASQPGIAVNVRGFEGWGRTAVTVDGVPQNFRSTGHGASGFAFVDENLLAGIDVTRGAVTTGGGGGIAGAVNFRTLEAADIVEGTGSGGRVRLGWGEQGDNISTTVVAAQRGERFDILAGMTRRSAGNYADADGNVVNNSRIDTESALLRGTFRLDGGHALSFSGMRYRADLPATQSQEYTSNLISLGYAYDPGDPLWNLTASLFSNDTGLYNLTTGIDRSSHTTGLNVTNVSRFDLAGWSVISTNGFEYSRDVASSNQASGVNPSDARAVNGALFTENTFTLDRLSLSAGLRLGRYRLSSDQPAISIGETYADPRLSLSYQVTDWLQPYVTLSRATRAPSMNEVFVGGNHGTPGSSFIPNPLLQPETSRGVELGFNFAREGIFTRDDRISGRLNYYRMDVDNYITGTWGTYTNIFGQTGTAFINVPGRSRVTGTELEVNYRNQYLTGVLSYARSNSHLPPALNGFGNSQYLPDSSASLSLAGHFLDQRLTVGATYTYQSGGRVSAFGFGPGGAIDAIVVEDDNSYGLVDLFASYELTSNARLSLRVSNAANRQYQPRNADSGLRGEGRNVFLGAEFNF